MRFASRFGRAFGGLCAVISLFSLSGCAGGPLARLNPVLRREWEEDEKYGPTVHTKRKELAQVRNKAARYSPEEQEQLSQDLTQLFNTQTHTVLRRDYIATLAEFSSPTAESTLRAALQDSNREIRIAAIEAWRIRDSTESVSLLANSLGSDADFDVRLAAARALADFPEQPSAVQALGLALDDPNPAMQNRAMQSLKEVTGKDFGDNVPKWQEFVRSGGTIDSDSQNVAGRVRRLFF